MPQYVRVTPESRQAVASWLMGASQGDSQSLGLPGDAGELAELLWFPTCPPTPGLETLWGLLSWVELGALPGPPNV